jgi:hypothetical protein
VTRRTSLTGATDRPVPPVLPSGTLGQASDWCRRVAGATLTALASGRSRVLLVVAVGQRWRHRVRVVESAVARDWPHPYHPFHWIEHASPVQPASPGVTRLAGVPRPCSHR